MKRLLTSCFGLGWLPIAPGTWGSIPPAVIFAIMSLYHLTGSVLAIVLVAMCLASSAVCVICSPASIAKTARKDPSEVVADEFAGQSLTFLPLVFIIPENLTSNKTLIIALAGFLLFRIFDIIKPWPIKKLEKFPDGWGILADDLLAGIYAAIVLTICTSLWIIK